MADWGLELWDKYEAVTDYVQRGIDFGERYAQFLKERLGVEQEYASKLKKVVERYQPKKKEEEEYKMYSGQHAFVKCLSELQSIANLHERLAEDLHTQLYVNVTKMYKELREKRKQHLNDGQSKQRELKQSQEQLEKSKRTYERAFRESEKALDNYHRVDSDINLSRAEVEKAKNLHLQRSRHCEQCKSDYAAQLQHFNEAQHKHFTIAMPSVFRSLQECDRHRSEQIQRFMLEAATLELQVLPIVGKCIEACQQAAQGISTEKDADTVVSKNKTGFSLPPDVEFEDLSNPAHATPDTGSSASLSRSRTPASSGKSTVGRRGGRGLFKLLGNKKEDEEDFSNLPPTQRCKRLQQKIDSLHKDQQKETQEREGILKMRDVYAQNPAMGDSSTLEPRLEENSRKLDALKTEIDKYQGYLADAQNALTPQTHRKDHVSTPSTHTSELGSNGDASSLASHSASDVSSHETQQQRVRNDSFEEDGYQALGSCKALYPFPATAEGSISMQEGEEFTITENDQGDGWTRVRQDATGVEGYVPSTYIEVVQLYEAV